MSLGQLPNRYYARDGRVYVKVDGEAPREVSSALTARGRELERFEKALQKATRQALDDLAGPLAGDNTVLGV